MCQSRQGEVMQQECNLIYTSEFFPKDAFLSWHRGLSSNWQRSFWSFFFICKRNYNHVAHVSLMKSIQKLSNLFSRLGQICDSDYEGSNYHVANDNYHIFSKSQIREPKYQFPCAKCQLLDSTSLQTFMLVRGISIPSKAYDVDKSFLVLRLFKKCPKNVQKNSF